MESDSDDIWERGLTQQAWISGGVELREITGRAQLAANTIRNCGGFHLCDGSDLGF